MFGIFKRRKKKDPRETYKNVTPKGPSWGEKVATRFSDFMSKREEGTSFKKRKVVLVLFCGVMLLLLWLPLFLRQKPHVVHNGHIVPPIDLSREDYRLQNKYLDSAIAAQHRRQRQEEKNRSGDTGSRSAVPAIRPFPLSKSKK